MQDKELELKIKLRILKETPDLWRLFADKLNISRKDALLELVFLKDSYLEELREIQEKHEKEKQKQQKLF